jgi:N-acetylglucosaminyl-diphospho-decaprenol L-rhamnosyltransferase
MDLSVLIVTYRNPDLTRDCLASVFAQIRDVSFEVVVVDNASGDGTAEMIEREFPAVRLIRSEVNLGFGRANNVAATAARGEHLLLLNPDTVVLDRAPERLLAFARGEPAPGVYGGRTLSPSGELDPRSCWGRQTLWSAFCFATGLSTAFSGHRLLDPESLGRWQRDSVRDVGVVTGCLLLVPRSLWVRLGGFDERFFMYGEDADLAARARALGCPVRITPDATIVHVVGASSDSGEKMSMIMKARATIVRKHWRRAARPAGLALLLAGVLLRAAGRRRGMWATVWRARRDWIRGYPPVPA